MIFPNLVICLNFIAMHHCKKFFVALQELFAATQQINQKPLYLIKNRGLRA
jgi:hypothetical protein